MKIRKAKIEDKNFVINANDRVNQVSGITSKSKLSENFEKDFFGRNPKAYCIIAEEKGKQIGFLLYSYVYWANKGRGLYLSNAFVDPDYRGKGVLNKLMGYVKKTRGVSFSTMIVGNENKNIQEILSHYGAEDIEMKTYYLKQEEK